MPVRMCPCGSGKERHELYDAAGIFCTFYCEDCDVQKRAKFNQSIFDRRSRYAVTGEEEDIE